MNILPWQNIYLSPEERDKLFRESLPWYWQFVLWVIRKVAPNWQPK